MNAIEKATIIQYHRQQIQKEKDDALKVGWSGKEAQQKRFEVLCGISDLNNKVIMDVGCGLGDLKKFIDRKYKNVVYLGIDHVPEFIEGANKRLVTSKFSYFKVADFTTDGLPDVDYALVSGAFNYQTTNLLFPFNVIEKLYRLVKQGVAFNLLDRDAFAPNDLLKSYNRYEVYGFCQRLAKRAELVTGYLPDDFTIMMYK